MHSTDDAGLHQDRDLPRASASLVDRERLALKSPLLGQLFLGSRAAALRHFDRANGLRNRLAHGHDLVTGASWEEVIDTVVLMKRLTDRLEAASDVGAGGAQPVAGPIEGAR